MQYDGYGKIINLWLNPTKKVFVGSLFIKWHYLILFDIIDTY